MTGLLVLMVILFLLAVLPLGASIIYNHEGVEIRAIAGLVRLRIFPKKQKNPAKKEKRKKVKPKNKKQENPKEGERKATEQKKGGSLTDFLPLIRTGLAFLNDFRKKLRINRLEMKLIMAGDDPCDLAVNYSRAWTALGNLIPGLEEFLVIKSRDLQVECDFTADKTTIYARLDLTITLGRLLSLGIRYGIRGLREYLKINKLRKGGAVK